jgi:hypothetical protein
LRYLYMLPLHETCRAERFAALRAGGLDGRLAEEQALAGCGWATHPDAKYGLANAGQLALLFAACIGLGSIVALHYH